MPIYEYRCQECDDSFDVLTSYAERDRPQTCPACASRQTRVLVSSFAALGSSETAASGSPLPMAGGGGCCGGSCGCGGH